MSRIPLATAVAGLAIFTAACGGPSATAQFAAKVNAVCTMTNSRLGALQPPGKALAGTGQAAVTRLVAREIPIDDAEIAHLDGLKPPVSERSAYDDAVAQARDDIALLPKILAAMRANKQAELTSITEQSTALSDLAVAAMKRLGLRPCARNL
jgi:hypothetical protein